MILARAPVSSSCCLMLLPSTQNCHHTCRDLGHHLQKTLMQRCLNIVSSIHCAVCEISTGTVIFVAAWGTAAYHNLRSQPPGPLQPLLCDETGFVRPCKNNANSTIILRRRLMSNTESLVVALVESAFIVSEVSSVPVLKFFGFVLPVRPRTWKHNHRSGGNCHSRTCHTSQLLC